MKVEDLELVVEYVIRVTWGCLNGRLHFSWLLSLMSVEANVSSIGECLFWMVM